MSLRDRQHDDDGDSSIRTLSAIALHECVLTIAFNVFQSSKQNGKDYDDKHQTREGRKDTGEWVREGKRKRETGDRERGERERVREKRR